nr:NADH dehydrogenase subunit 6 [Chiropterargas confusus]
MKIMSMVMFLFIMSTSPITMMLIMIITMMNLIIFMYMLSKNSWYPMITMLLVMGGLMVILLYITNLTPNMKTHFNYKLILLMPIFLYSWPHWVNCYMNSNKTLYSFNNITYVIMMMLMLYLLYTLLQISYLMKSFMSPMKSN